jgi:hypothetical protein
MLDEHSFFSNSEMNRQKYLDEKAEAREHMQGELEDTLTRLTDMIQNNRGHIGAISFSILAKHGDAMEVRPGNFSDGGSAFCVGDSELAPALIAQLKQLVARTDGRICTQREIPEGVGIEQMMRKLMNPDGE